MDSVAKLLMAFEVRRVADALQSRTGEELPRKQALAQAFRHVSADLREIEPWFDDPTYPGDS